MRFYFDYKTKDNALYDYEGEEFSSTNAAYEFALATMQSLKNSLAGYWKDWLVEVHNAEGTKFFSLPVNSDAFSERRRTLGTH